MTMGKLLSFKNACAAIGLTFSDPAEIYLIVLHDPFSDTGITTAGYIFVPERTNKHSHEVPINSYSFSLLQ